MSEQKHTPGKLYIAEEMGWDPNRTVQYEVAVVYGDEIFHLHEGLVGQPTPKDGDTQKANARRLAACWNEHDGLIAQRDALLAVLKGIKTELADPENDKLYMEIETMLRHRGGVAGLKKRIAAAAAIIKTVEGKP